MFSKRIWKRLCRFNIIYRCPLVMQGQMSLRFFQLRNEVKIFVKINKNLNDFDKKLNELDFLESLAFLTDICQHFNEVNLKLQGNNTDVFLIEVIDNFIKYLNVLKRDILGDLDYFKCCQEIKSENCLANFQRFS